MSVDPPDPAASTPEAPARFVVGTGRCGSTLLSRMLGTHEAVLNLSEVFTGLDWGRRFAPGRWTGAEVADLLTTPNEVIDIVVGRGYDVEEVTYPFERAGARYHRGDPVPWIAVAMLGHLTDDVDALLDDVVGWLERRPAAPVERHYRDLFGWLAARAGVRHWVERSGSSVDYVGELVRLFPEAKVVHLVRDGFEVALSMRHHPAFRLSVQLLYDVVPPGVDPSDATALLDAWLGADPPIDLYGRYWSDQLANGMPTLAALPPSQVLTVSFEAVVRDPRAAMAQIAAFLDLPRDPGFEKRAAGLVRGRPRRRAGSLAPAEIEALGAACAPGQELLDRVRQ